MRSAEKRKYLREDIYLLPGEVHVTEKPILIKTLLGSCVSVILYDPHLRLGGISHAQLPNRGSECCHDACPVRCLHDSPDANNFKYVVCAVAYLIERFMERGSELRRIEGKLFGGASILKPGGDPANSVGQRNIEAARNLLQAKNIAISKENVGGNVGRTLYFQPPTGLVLLRKQTAEF